MMTLLIDGRPLGTMRIAIGLASLLITLENFAKLSSIAGGKMTFPFFSWFLPINEQSIGIAFVVGILGSIGLIVGFQSRVAAGTVALLTAFVLLWDQQIYSNHHILLLSLCTYLTISQPGAAMSLDARARAPRDVSIPYWPQLLIMTQISIVYFFTALAKVNPFFLSGDLLRKVIWVPLPDYAYVPLSLSAVALEFLLAFALWSRRLVKIAIVLGVILHVSIVMALDQPLVLFAFAALTVGTYPLFYARARGPRDTSKENYSETRRRSSSTFSIPADELESF